jgi:hypothetical protein
MPVAQSAGSTNPNPKATHTVEVKYKVEVVKLQALYTLPPGIDLIPGATVMPRPLWLHTGSWIELIKLDRRRSVSSPCTVWRGDNASSPSLLSAGAPRRTMWRRWAGSASRRCD